MSAFDDLADQVQAVTHSSQLKSIVGRIVAELASVAARLDALEKRVSSSEETEADTLPPKKATPKRGST
ncbi:hypothetical protein AB0I81_34825 [Nonomuraea sp. NPDC050404]|uniref:hypothetical protein n=1 Tax=Nonomuraea sp. NPDC050404 TaxID=3155783 RepID=UPI0033EA2939